MQQSTEYSIRRAVREDAATIASQRAAMFRDMGDVTDEQAEVLRLEAEPWLAGLMATGGYEGWLCEHGNAIVAGGGILVVEVGPRPGCLRLGRAAHVVNMYTHPEHRRCGLARRLMNEILDWCQSNGMVQITLAASDEGRPLYESLGFRPTNDMKLAGFLQPRA